ncbi:MAG TPA: ABC transporter ATP-binding protein [Anaerolineae bacterium]|nr:ABC transporter ATP-binding protein [Anaerolineae bacterium]
MGTTVIEVKDLVRRFGRLTALNGLSLQVAKGEIFGFVGPNGAGKTTTIRVLLGLCHLDRGTACVLGYDVGRDFSKIGPRLGIVLESFGLYEDLTGLENLDYHGRLFALSVEQRAARSAALLEAVGLQDRARDRVKTYSKGMKQRLAVALALLNDPELLLLDEPFDGIDTETHRRLRALIRDLSQQHGKTIFLTSHNLDDVEKLATRVAVIHKGQLLTCGTVDGLQSQVGRNAVKFVFARCVSADEIRRVLTPLALAEAFILNDNQVTVSLDGSVTTETLVEQLALSRLPIREVTPVKTSLEEAYFAMLSADRRAVREAG